MRNKPEIQTFIWLLFLVPLSTFAQYFPKAPQPWRDAYNISLSGFEFSHPMTVLNKADLAAVKARIANNVEPQKSAFTSLLAEARVQLNFVPDAPSTMNIMGGYEPNSNLSEMREWLWRNCHAAYTCALAYAMTDDNVYAEKAKEVLMNWANKNTFFTGNDRGLQLGSWFSPMLYAADLIYNYTGWPEEEKTVFKTWWKNYCLLNGQVLDVMRSRDNNWKDAGLLGVFSAAVVLEDSLYLKEALVQLSSYFYSRTDSYVDNPGPGWKIKKDSLGVYLPREVVRNDGSSGLTYTAYALTTMMQCFEIARYAGFDFWENSTQEGTTIKDVIEQYFAWDIKNQPFPWNSSPNKTDKRRNCYELANTFLDVDAELHEWVINNWPVISGREGDEYCTLNKGDLLGTGIVPPIAPGNLSAVAVSDKLVNLFWVDNSDSEEGFTIERKVGQSSYFALGKIGANITSFQDKLFLTDLTTYTYRIKAYNKFSTSDYSNEATVTTLPKGYLTVALRPTDDATIAGGTNGENNFGSGDLLVRNSSIADSARKSYIKFDLTGLQIEMIKSAIVLLYANVAVPTQVIVYQAPNNWDENSLTWNNAPAVGSQIDSTQLSAEPGYYEWDITSFVQNGTFDSHVFSLAFCGGDLSDEGASFYSKEAGHNIPELRIITTEPLQAGILRDEKVILPQELTLQQNYPNPFNSSTRIEYSITKAAFVSLKIYDVLGREIATLENGAKKPGVYIADFDGNNLASGIYFYKLKAGSFSMVKKFLLQN